MSHNFYWTFYKHALMDWKKVLSRSSTARGSGTAFSLVGPTKVKAPKSFLCEASAFPHILDLAHLNVF